MSTPTQVCPWSSSTDPLRPDPQPKSKMWHGWSSGSTSSSTARSDMVSWMSIIRVLKDNHIKNLAHQQNYFNLNDNTLFILWSVFSGLVDAIVLKQKQFNNDNKAWFKISLRFREVPNAPASWTFWNWVLYSCFCTFQLNWKSYKISF